MQYADYTCHVLPQPDVKVLKTIQEAIERAKLKPKSINCGFRHITEEHPFALNEFSGTRPLKGIIQNNSSSLLRLVRIAFAEPNEGHFVYSNPLSTDNKTAPKATFQFSGIGVDPEDKWKERISLFVSLVRKGLGAVDGAEGTNQILGPDLKSHYKSREQELTRLEGVADNFFERLQEFEAKQQENYQQRQAELEEQLILKSRVLEEEHKQRMKAQQEEYDEWERTRQETKKKLEDWENKLEALNNTDERRKTRIQIREELKHREDEFILTKGTQAKRRPVHKLFLFVIFGALVAFGIFLWLLVKEETTDPWTKIVLIARVAIAGVVFFTSLIYYLRWNMDWFERHAAEEFRNKRQILDMDRATWLSEFALEWYGVTDTEIPPEMLEALSRELYVADGTTKSDKKNAADVVASALFGSASNVRCKLGNVEAEIDRKAAKKMGKTEMD